MKNKFKFKKIMVIIISFLLIVSIANFVNASYVKAQFSGNLSGDGGDAGIKASTKIVSSVLGVTRTIGVSIAIVILIVIGCKYMIASAGDRADMKKYATNYIIGALILFGASALVSIAKKFTDDALKDM